MDEQLKCLQQLYKQVEAALGQLNDRQERDLSRAYFTVLRNEVASCIIESRVHQEFIRRLPQEFEEVVGGVGQVGNYLATFCQHLDEVAVGTFIFQTELLFRRYWIANGGAPDAKIPSMLAFLFDDTENNWKKEESKLMMFIWKIRNTIHTGGIYFGADCTKEYGGMQFQLKDGFPPDISPIGGWYGLLAPAVAAVLGMVLSDRICALGHVEHPNFKAVGK